MNIETANQHLIINQIKNSAQDPVKIKKQYINLEKEKKMKTKLTKEYLQEVSNKIHNNTYLITGEYVNNITPIEMIHLVCGTKFKTVFNSHKKGRGCCSKCFLSVKKTKEQLQQESNKIHNNEYEIIGDYINTDTKIEIKHKICGGIFTQTPDKHLRHNKCPICHGKNPLNIDILQSRSDKKYNGEYTIIGEYVNVATPILIRHNICGTEYLQIPNNHLRRKCFNCYGTPKRTNNQFQIESDKLHKSEYTLISDYKDANTPVYMKHKKCGKVFDIIPYSHIKYLSKCKYCYNSKGENKISDFLDELKIKYVKGKRFDGCKHKGKLIFDFFIEKLNMCIEYDGEQHFKSIKWFGGDEALKNVKIRDNIKNKFCQDNNIKLIRISYMDDVELKLKEIFNI